MNTYLNHLKSNTNLGRTENGAIKRTTTNSNLLDLFSLGGAYRSRSDEDVLALFSAAFAEDPVYALKCLFYLRDAREGQGERRFFRVCLRWLATYHTEEIKRNLEYVVEFGRWDDLYAFVGTKLEKDAFDFMYRQLSLDVESKTPSLLAKWLKSENTSSRESRALAAKTRKHFNMTPKQYRKTLSILRERIRVLERLMSAGRWEEIEFDKIPSVAGFKYRNAFARRDIIKAKYEAFAKDETTSVNADVLYPYQCVSEAIKVMRSKYWDLPVDIMDTERLMINKYWENLADYIKNAKFNGIAVVDVSGSMAGTPLEVAVSLGMYCAEKNSGPFANHFITFSNTPKMVEIQGPDFCGKVKYMIRADWGMSTNIAGVFDLLLDTALKNGCAQEEIPENIIIISDMEFNDCTYSYGYSDEITLFEHIERKWSDCGYKMPKLTFWNVNARSNNIPMRDNGRVNFVSGFSPTIFEQVMQGLSAWDLMMNKLNSERYACIK